MTLQPAINATLKTALEFGVFDKMGNANSDECTAAELASATHTELTLMRRLLRLLGAAQILQETGVDRYKATPFAHALQKPGYASGFRHYYATILPVLSSMPQYFLQNGRKNPDNSTDGPWQYGHKTSQPLWDWLRERPQYQTYFDEYFAVTHELSPLTWLDAYPVSQLLAPIDTHDLLDHPLIVDVGGGMGEDMDRLRQTLLPQRYDIVVQDMASVVEKAKNVRPEIRYMEHDFFTVQPLQGARAYFLRSVLHNWSDEKACEILRALFPAMKRGYSALLLCENIMPERAAPPVVAALDIAMMGLMNGQTRTETDWRKLLTMAGFQLTNIWRPAGPGQCVIEAEIVEFDS